jgi:hypothetical protein
MTLSRPRSARTVRRKRSGVVLFEALIAISMITVFFGGVVFFHNVYVAKTRALREARTMAWLATEKSCQGGGQGAASELALVPTTYARVSGSELSLPAKLEMSCNERNSEHKDIWAVFEWAGVAEQMSSFTQQIISTIF